MSSESSKAKIKTAFLNQLEDKSYAKITITGIADDLGMTRQNIYRSYSSKEQIYAEIVEDSLNDIFLLIEETAPILDDHTWDNLVDLGVNLLMENKDGIRLIFQVEEETLLFQIVHAFIRRSLGHLVRIQGLTVRDTEYFEFVSNYLTGSGFHVVKAWSRNDMQVPPEKVAKIFKSQSGILLMELIKECE